jgi:hypothetical protein
MKKGSGYDQSYRGWILYPSLYLCLWDNHLLQHRPNNQIQKEMNYYKYIAMMVALSAFVAIVTMVEAPRKPKKETVHVLPLVEEMATANPLQF